MEVASWALPWTPRAFRNSEIWILFWKVDLFLELVSCLSVLTVAWRSCSAVGVEFPKNSKNSKSSKVQLFSLRATWAAASLAAAAANPFCVSSCSFEFSRSLASFCCSVFSCCCFSQRACSCCSSRPEMHATCSQVREVVSTSTLMQFIYFFATFFQQLNHRKVGFQLELQHAVLRLDRAESDRGVQKAQKTEILPTHRCKSAR